MSQWIARLLQGFAVAGQILQIAVTLDTVGGEAQVPSVFFRFSGREYELYGARLRRNS